MAGISHTTPFSVLAEISSHGKSHWISSPIKLCNLWRNSPSGKVAMFVGLILHWEKVGGGAHPDASFAQSQYSPYPYPHPWGSGYWLLATLLPLESPRESCCHPPQGCWHGRLQSCLADQGSISCLCLCAAMAIVGCFNFTLHSFFSPGAKSVEFSRFVTR